MDDPLVFSLVYSTLSAAGLVPCRCVLEVVDLPPTIDLGRDLAQAV